MAIAYASLKSPKPKVTTLFALQYLGRSWPTGIDPSSATQYGSPWRPRTAGVYYSNNIVIETAGPTSYITNMSKCGQFEDPLSTTLSRGVLAVFVPLAEASASGPGVTMARGKGIERVGREGLEGKLGRDELRR
jgi:hypothetical protein